MGLYESKMAQGQEGGRPVPGFNGNVQTLLLPRVAFRTRRQLQSGSTPPYQERRATWTSMRSLLGWSEPGVGRSPTRGAAIVFHLQKGGAANLIPPTTIAAGFYSRIFPTTSCLRDANVTTLTRFRPCEMFSRVFICVAFHAYLTLPRH